MKIRIIFNIAGCGRVGYLMRLARCGALMLAATGLGTLTLTAQTNFVTLGNAKAHPTRILARYKNQVILAAGSNVLRQAGSRLQRHYRQMPQLAVLEAVEAPSGGSETMQRNRLIQRINDLKRTGLFEYVEPDYLVEACLAPTDQAFVDGSLWGLKNSGQDGGVAGADIAAPAAWNLTTGNTNVIVAVIDTGIRYTHQDLAHQMWLNPGESGGGKEANGVDDDVDGYIDNVYGINAITGSGDPKDDHDHGTHVAGTIGAAANDGNPHVGVAWNVRLMACKFLPADGGGAISDAIECIDFAVSKGARILNNSWGGGGYSQALYDSINDARARGVLFVAAAGNNSTDNDQLPFYPCNYDLDNVISVAALTRQDLLADFSNFGQSTVDLGAPGESIFSSTAGSDTEYQYFSGTSMAAPHVSGVAALILSQFPAADLAELRDRILLGTVAIPALTGVCTTAGRLNAYNSLTVSGSGILQVSVDPPSGSTLLTSSSQPVYVSVTDLFGVTDATVTASIAGSSNLTFLNDGQPPDAVASNGVYSATFSVPAATNPVTLTVTASAPGKVGRTNIVTYSVVPPPPNDYFTNATKVPSAGGLYQSNNRFATRETGEPKPASVAGATASLWWVWTPASGTNVIVDTTGSAIDTVLAVYTGNVLSNLVTVVATNDVGFRKQGYVSFNAQGGTAYRIVVAGADTNSLGSIQLRVTPGGQPDTALPQVLVNSPLSGVTVATNLISVAGVAVDLAPDATGISEVFLGVNGAIAYSASGTTNWAAPALLQPGNNVIVVSAVDAAGNVSPSATLQVNYFAQNPVNDLMVNAIALTGKSGAQSNVSTATATKEVGEPIHAGNSGGKSVWWTFQPPADGVLTLGTTNSGFDTLLGLYTGSQVNSLTTIAGNDDAYDGAPGGFSSLSAAVHSNQVYRITVDGYDGVSGVVSLQYSFVTNQLFHLTGNGTLGGTVAPTSLDVQSNGTASVTATADPGYLFDSWDGDIASLANPVAVLMSSNRTITARFLPIVFTEDFESGGLQHLSWTTAGGNPWIVQSNTVLAGKFAAQSGATSGGGHSSLLLTTNFVAGNVSFNIKVSSEQNFDTVGFYVDGILRQHWSGEVGWVSYAFPLTAGLHTLEWRYAKDASGSAGSDAAFLDNLNLPLEATRLQQRQLTDGTFFVDLLGLPGRQVVVQASSNLVTWQDIATNAIINGRIHFVDPAGTTNPMRFYRAME